MSDLKQRIVDHVRDRFGAGRLQGTILYLDPEPKRAADRIAVGDVVIEMPWDGYIAFADLEPQANWGHACAYLAVRADGDDAVDFPAQMPPFLKADGPRFRLLWRGPSAPEWAVAGEGDLLP